MDISYSIPDVAFLGGGPFTPVNTETAAFFARLATQPTKGRAQLYDAMITALKAGGVWSTFDVFYVLAGADSATARTNLVSSSFTASAVNAPTFTANQGVSGNGSTSYLDTNYSPSTTATNFGQNAGHMSMWDMTDRAVDTTFICGNHDSGTAEILLTPFFSGNAAFFRINDGSNSLASTASPGFWLASRSNSTTVTGYKNGASLGNTTAATSQPIATGNVFICGSSSAGTLFLPTTDRISIFSIGGTLTGTQVTAFYNAVHAYLQAVAGIA